MGLGKFKLALLFFALAASAEAQQQAGEKIRGFDLDTLALATAKATAFSTQYGIAQGAESFDAWLRQQGLSLADYDQAYSVFLKRFEEDGSGRLEESYFAALDRYAPGAERPAPQESAAAELAAGNQGSQIDAAYRADAWATVEATASGQTDATAQARRIDQLLADSQSRASTSFLATQDASAKKFAEAMASLRPGTLPPGLGPNLAVPAGTASRPQPAPLKPGSLEAQHAALQSADAETRRAAARPFAFECDGLALVAPAGREADPRSRYCHGAILRDLWLPVAWEILDAAPEQELHRVAPLLPYLETFGFAEPSRLALEALHGRLKDAERAAAAELAAALSAPERILLGARCSTLREILAAVEKSLGTRPPA
jgi:hypothetical protein